MHYFLNRGLRGRKKNSPTLNLQCPWKQLRPEFDNIIIYAQVSFHFYCKQWINNNLAVQYLWISTIRCIIWCALYNCVLNISSVSIMHWCYNFPVFANVSTYFNFKVQLMNIFQFLPIIVMHGAWCTRHYCLCLFGDGRIYLLGQYVIIL